MSDRADGRNTVLAVDDEPDLLESIVRILEGERLRVVTTSDPEEVLELVERESPAVVLTDFRMPRKNGMDLLKEMVERFPGMPVVMISAYATGDGVVESVKQGAFDYLIKPFSCDELVVTVNRALEYARLRRENARLSTQAREERFRNAFCGSSPEMVRCVGLVAKVAASSANVLITGERGVGKELAARTIHCYGARAQGPFRMVNCETLADAPVDETAGECATWNGLFEVSEGGTIYLARIERLSPPLQAKLVSRIWQSRPSVPSRNALPAGVRVIASTLPDPEGEVKAGSLSPSLLRTLDVVRISMPPLRSRARDIGPLCDFFLRQADARTGGAPASLDPEVAPALMEYAWPGNVRELKSAVENALAASGGTCVRLADFPPEIRRPSGIGVLSYKDARKRWLDQFEKRYLEELLAENNANISKASEQAGMARMSLYRMMRRVGFDQNGLRHVIEQERRKSGPNGGK
ncbi:MAG: sigma-54-dependent Fis family transcriptional regulator [Nitrospinae bacterium]|nr:sigma-54-dependent Fis family transcriptional regulator [Nitrospinota bacterium]